jgi:hypothetical protein
MSQMPQVPLNVQFKCYLNFKKKTAGKILIEIWILWRFGKKLNIFVLTV